MLDPDNPVIDYAKLRSILELANNLADLKQAIVNAPFQFKMETAFLFLGIIVLLLVDKEEGTINRVALSKTELAENTKNVSVKKFEEIKIPLGHQENIIAKAIETGQPQETTNWKDLFTPALSEEQAKLNQASGGIAFSAVYPLKGFPDGGAMIFSYYQYGSEIGQPQKRFMEEYSRIVSDVSAKRIN